MSFLDLWAYLLFIIYLAKPWRLNILIKRMYFPVLWRWYWSGKQLCPSLAGNQLSHVQYYHSLNNWKWKFFLIADELQYLRHFISVTTCKTYNVNCRSNPVSNTRCFFLAQKCIVSSHRSTSRHRSFSHSLFLEEVIKRVAF